VIALFGLIIPGVYLLINDFTQEEKRGTLNFIRLSPQSAKNILIGKILGVPILVYFAFLLALPFYLYAGFAGQVHPSIIFSFLITLILTCIFCYITALLFGLFGQGFRDFTPWIGSGLILCLLCLIAVKPISQDATDWLNFFSPLILLNFIPKYMPKYGEISFDFFQIEQLKFFSLPIGESFFRTRALIIINLGAVIWCLWTSIHGRFVNPTKPILTKKQSYLLVALWQLILLGFSWYDYSNNIYPVKQMFEFMLVSNMMLFLALIAALSPQRQTLLDWARYRHENKTGFSFISLIKDLLFHQESPAILTIVVNLGIMTGILTLGIISMLSNVSELTKHYQIWIMVILICLSINATMILIYAIIAQTILFMRSPRASQLAIGAIATLVLIPIPLLSFLGISAEDHPLFWTFTAMPWLAITNGTITKFMSIFLIPFLSQLSIFSILTARFGYVLRKAGESETKALLSQSKI
ncbi:MAG TPA: hypothetical protein V6C58_13015, partial [Allocoleopsis sp.]